LGSLCVIDDEPRTSFSAEESEDLEDMGLLVMREIELYTVSITYQASSLFTLSFNTSHYLEVAVVATKPER